jgi:hypothetical protein
MRAVRRAVLVAVVVASTALAPTAATASSINGVVTDANTHLGIPGIEVCPSPEPYIFERECVKTGSMGGYTIAALGPTAYKLEFRAFAPGLNYVREWYGGDQEPSGDAVTIGSYDEAVNGIDAELEPGGVMTGTATDATTGGPAAGVWVFIDAASPVFYGTGAQANEAGEFSRDDMPTGEYTVSFAGWSDANYLHRYYKDAESFASATNVPVITGETVSGIDQALYPGAQIFGRVTDVESGEPLYEVRVCASPADEENAEWCDKTDLDGNYTIRSLPADTYFIEFGAENGPFGHTVGQWWDHAESREEAEPLTVETPETLTGIDGAVPSSLGQEPPGPEIPPRDDSGETAPVELRPPAQVQLLPLVGRTPLPKCHKGFHRKLVKGKKRCVRKHLRHQHRRHRR